MKNLRDFEIRKFFEGEMFSSAGFINEILSDITSTTFKTSKMDIKVTIIDGLGIKVEIDAGDELQGLSIPHKEPEGTYSGITIPTPALLRKNGIPLYTSSAPRQ